MKTNEVLNQAFVGIITGVVSQLILEILGFIFQSVVAILAGYLLLVISIILILFGKQYTGKNSTSTGYIYKTYKQLRSLPTLSRVIIIVVLIIVPVPSIVYYHSSQTVPAMCIKIINNGSEEMSISNRGEFYLTLPNTPASDIIVASGKVDLYILDKNDRDKLLIPPYEELTVYGKIVNPVKYRTFLENGDTDMLLILSQENGEMVHQSGIPFDMNTLSNLYITVEI